MNLWVRTMDDGPEPIRVTLESWEIMQAAFVGVRRQVAAIANGLKDKHDFDDEKGRGWLIHVNGACGELAYAKATAQYWSGTVNTFKRLPDVGSVDVRTRQSHWQELIIRKDDPDDRVFVLVTGLYEHYLIRGEYLAGEAKQHDDWVKTHGDREAAWFVPHAALKPLGTLARQKVTDV